MIFSKKGLISSTFMVGLIMALTGCVNSNTVNPLDSPEYASQKSLLIVCDTYVKETPINDADVEKYYAFAESVNKSKNPNKDKLVKAMNGMGDELDKLVGETLPDDVKFPYIKACEDYLPTVGK